MESSPQLLPDYTLVYQLAIFFACYWVMRVWVFGPYSELLKLRKAKTTGLKEKAIAEKAQAVELRTQYETTMAATKKKISTWGDEERRKAVEEERTLVQNARNTESKELDTLRKKIDTEVGAARTQLMSSIAEYSSNIATKLVGRTIDTSNFKREAEAEKGISSTLPG